MKEVALMPIADKSYGFDEFASSFPILDMNQYLDIFPAASLPLHE